MQNDFTNMERAEVLTAALPYIRKYTGQIVVVKYGGNAMVNEQLKKQVMEDIVLLWLTGVKVVLSTVYEALTEKGYNPVNQIVGYIMSGDPTYITSHKSARSLIMKVERDELVEELLTEYIRNNNW